jgi:hypothetical protein
LPATKRRQAIERRSLEPLLEHQREQRPDDRVQRRLLIPQVLEQQLRRARAIGLAGASQRGGDVGGLIGAEGEGLVVDSVEIGEVLSEHRGGLRLERRLGE